MTPQYILKHGIKGDQKSGMSEIENMNWAKEYAEPGYDQPKRGILFANWNYFEQRAVHLLGQKGFQCEWSDEWTTCEDCGKAVRTQPDSFCWNPSFIIEDECVLLCKECTTKHGQSLSGKIQVRYRGSRTDVMTCVGNSCVLGYNPEWLARNQ